MTRHGEATTYAYTDSIRMDSGSNDWNGPCPSARKRKAGSKKFDRKRTQATKGGTEKAGRQACEPCRKGDADPYSSVGKTTQNIPGFSSSSSSSSSSLSGNVGGGMTPFFDEEEVFNMHGLLDGMAEGLMVSPLGCGLDWGGVDYVDLTLWSSDV